MQHRTWMATTLWLAGASPALAQSDVSPVHKHSWGENIGFMNWRDAGDPDGAQGVRLHATGEGNAVLAGYVWCENTGWLSLGDGAPDNGRFYANADGADCGVNIDDTGVLSGLAWGENIGWVNFDTKAALQAFNQHARFDHASFRLLGYAWGENVGWINLDGAEHFVALICPADFDRNGAVNTQDVLAFLNAWRAGDPRADTNGDGRLDSRDIAAFLNLWVAGCA